MKPLLKQGCGLFLGLLFLLQGCAAHTLTVAPLKGSHAAIPENIASEMKKHSWREGCPVAIDKLAYLRLPHWGYDEKIHMGELIVHQDMAEEVVDIFEELFTAHFPIEKMQLIDAYKGSNDASMADNNTSAFNCHAITGKPGAFSLHSYGTAIDINPLINPYINKQKILPPMGKYFVDRSLDYPGLIKQGDSCEQAFYVKGWTWGGTELWLERAANRNYQHFQKKLKGL